MGNTLFRMKERLAPRRAAGSAGLVMGVLLGHIREGALLVDLLHLPVTEALEYKAECNPVSVWQ